MQYIFVTTIQFLFAFLVIYAIIGDAMKLVIPNWISLCLFLLFCLYCAWSFPQTSIALSLLSMCIVFTVAAIFFHFGLLGGGDVKFLTVLSLWAGPDNIIGFIVLVNILGALLTLLVLKSTFFSIRFPDAVEKNEILAKVASWRLKGICPYGIAIGSAALIVAPSIFA